MNILPLFTPCLRLLGLLSLAVVASCTVNPVTGKSELSLLDEDQEVSLGEAQYQPSQQAQGGPYVSDPDLTRYVQSIGQQLARVADRRLPYEFVIIDDSRPNAWALPGGKIAVNRGLLTRLNSEAELAAVLSHEIVHAAARHSAKSIERNLLLSSVINMAGSALADQNNRYATIFDSGAQLGAQFIVSSYGREAELESDAFGMLYMQRAGFDPMAAVTLQETFVALSKARSASWLDGMLASHPPSEERVRRNQVTAEQLRAGRSQPAIQGFDRYQLKLDRLSTKTQGYELAANAQESLDAGDLELAHRQINQALEVTQTEALLWGIAGQIALADEQPALSDRHFSRAIAINDRHFRYYLGRGLARQALAQLNGAISDLEASQQIFATDIAAKALQELQSTP
jgi:predicted Zn-dependent protease